MGIRGKTKNIVEKFLSGDSGKRFFQAFYSIGAAIVIIGALAKLNHWEGGGILLAVGLITEFFVFLISAFDRPYKEYHWEQVFPVLDSNEEEDRPEFGSGGVGGGGTVIVGGNSHGIGYIGGDNKTKPQSATEAVAHLTPGQVKQSFGIPSAVDLSDEDSNALTASIKKLAGAADQLSKMAEMTDATQQYLQQLTDMSENMQKFSSVTNNLTNVSDILLGSYKSITDNSDGINQSSRGYVQQMENLNRNIQGLNTIYEIQLKSISSQIDAIERINSGLMRIKDLYEGSIVDSSVFRSETEKMAQQLHALNGVYNRLLNAMTMNMYGAGGSPNFNPNISQAPYSAGI
ncbi:MAG: gliding motility protein GldL [Dysgonamonadaceae bacterium]|jgi:gliding motility-associated protein GldL|nr:gliding motility protein GldL [Dysgonamonadaceae bacterium]